MASSDNIEQRLIDLEVKASFTEDLVDQLEQVIVRQQRQIDLLIREISRLQEPSVEGGVGTARHTRDELPPHY